MNERILLRTEDGHETPCAHRTIEIATLLPIIADDVETIARHEKLRRITVDDFARDDIITAKRDHREREETKIRWFLGENILDLVTVYLAAGERVWEFLIAKGNLSS